MQDSRIFREIHKLIEVYGGSMFYLDPRGVQVNEARGRQPTILLEKGQNPRQDDIMRRLVRIDVLESQKASQSPTHYAQATLSSTDQRGVYSHVLGQSLRVGNRQFGMAGASKSPNTFRGKIGYGTNGGADGHDGRHGSPGRYGNSRSRSGNRDGKGGSRDKYGNYRNGGRRGGSSDEDSDSSYSVDEKTGKRRRRRKGSKSGKGGRRGKGSKSKSRKGKKGEGKDGNSSKNGKRKGKGHGDDMLYEDGYDDEPDGDFFKRVYGVDDLDPATMRRLRREMINNTNPDQEIVIGLTKYKPLSKSDMMAQAKEFRDFNAELEQLRLKGQVTDFYIVADNVKNDKDRVQVAAEVKKAVSEHKGLKPSKNGVLTAKKNVQTANKGTQTLKISDFAPQYPIVRYPTGYGPQSQVQVVAEPAFKVEVEKEVAVQSMSSTLKKAPSIKLTRGDTMKSKKSADKKSPALEKKSTKEGSSLMKDLNPVSIISPANSDDESSGASSDPYGEFESKQKESVSNRKHDGTKDIDPNQANAVSVSRDGLKNAGEATESQNGPSEVTGQLHDPENINKSQPISKLDVVKDKLQASQNQPTMAPPADQPAERVPFLLRSKGSDIHKLGSSTVENTSPTPKHVRPPVVRQETQESKDGKLSSSSKVFQKKIEPGAEISEVRPELYKSATEEIIVVETPKGGFDQDVELLPNDDGEDEMMNDQEQPQRDVQETDPDANNEANPPASPSEHQVSTPKAPEKSPTSVTELTKQLKAALPAASTILKPTNPSPQTKNTVGQTQIGKPKDPIKVTEPATTSVNDRSKSQLANNPGGNAQTSPAKANSSHLSPSQPQSNLNSNPRPLQSPQSSQKAPTITTTPPPAPLPAKPAPSPEPPVPKLTQNPFLKAQQQPKEQKPEGGISDVLKSNPFMKKDENLRKQEEQKKKEMLQKQKEESNSMVAGLRGMWK